MSSDENTYEEIGELSTDRSSALVGSIKDRSSSFRKKSLLSPDSDRLLYNYSSNPSVEDFAKIDATENYIVNGVATYKGDKYVFVGKNLITIYDCVSGNFYLESPKSVLSSLLNSVSAGGLGLTKTDFEAVCENLKYVVAIDQLAYVISFTASNVPVLFSIDPYTYEVSSVAYANFAKDIGNGSNQLFCKPFCYSKTIYFISRDNTGTVSVNSYAASSKTWSDSTGNQVLLNLITGITSKTTVIKDSLVALHDEVSHKIFFISCVNSSEVTSKSCIGVYAYNSDVTSPAVTGAALSLGGRTIKQAEIYTDSSTRTPSTYIALLLDNNTLKFIKITDGSSLSSVDANVVTYTFTKSYGITGFAKVATHKDSGGNNVYGFYVLVKNTSSTVSAVYIKQSDVVSDATIDVSTSVIGNASKYAFINSLSDNINIIRTAFSSTTYNLIVGNYEEAGRFLPLIKDFSTDVKIATSDSDVFNAVHGKMFRTCLDKNCGVSLVKGLPYGNMQMSRVRLFPETILNEDTTRNVKDTDPVCLRETSTDKTEYTTGSYIWNVLNKMGIPYNTHIDAVGRIIINGYDIPINKVLITKAAATESFGDVLFTFDKLFDISIIKDALSEDLIQYPGVLFFKNKGFLQDAAISNSYVMEGSLTYNDAAKGALFSNGIHTISASIRVNDTTLVVGTNFGSIASINIQTGGFVSSSGTQSGDNPPVYCKTSSTLGTVEKFAIRNSNLYAVFSSGSIYKTPIGSNSWTMAYSSSNPPQLHIAVEVKDNLLILSTAAGNIDIFDMDTNKYIAATSAKSVPSSTVDSYAVNAAFAADDCTKLGNRIYYVTKDASTARLCWFDTITNTFGTSKNLPTSFATNHSGANVTTDGTYVYIVGSSDINSTSFTRYDPLADSFTPLSVLPFKTTHSGAFVKSGKVIIPFGMNSTSKYIMVYDILSGIWMTYLLSNSASVPTVYNAKYIRYTASNGDDIVRLMFGTTDVSSISYATLQSSFIDINLSISDYSNSVSITTCGSTRYYGANPYLDGTTMYVSGGKAYTSSAVTDNDLFASDMSITYIGNTTTRIKHGSEFIGMRFDDAIYELGGTFTSDTSTSDNVVYYETRTGKFHTVYNIAHYETSTATYKPQISCMKVIGSDRYMLLIVYTDGGIASIDLRDGTYYAPKDSTVRIRCLHRIFAYAGEFISEGATSIDEVGDDVYIHCPTKTLRWSNVIGVFFDGDSDKTLTGKCTGNGTGFDFARRSIKPLSGSSKVSIGKYVVFMNGYDGDSTDDFRTTLHRGIVVYDTKLDNFAYIAKGVNAAGVDSGETNAQSATDEIYDGTIERKYNAYSLYNNGYIYTFGGIGRYSERFNGSTSVVNRRLCAIERYDLVSGEVIELGNNRTYGYINPITDLYTPSGGTTEIKRSFIGSKEVRYVSRMSQASLFEKFDTDVIAKNRYLIGFITMADSTEETVSEYATSSSTVKDTFKTNCLFMMDTYTENTVNIFNGRLVGFDSISAEDVVIPVERYLNSTAVTQYLIAYSKKKITIYELSIARGSYVLTSKAVYADDNASDMRRGIVPAFYDEANDTVILPRVQIRVSGLAKTISFDCTNNTFHDFKIDASGIFTVDDLTSSLNRVIPMLDVEDDKSFMLDDITYRAKIFNSYNMKSLKSSSYSSGSNTTDQISLTKVFNDGYINSATSFAGLSSARGVAQIGNSIYKGLYIPSTDSTYDNIAELGTSGKTRFVVLKFDTVTGYTSIQHIEYFTNDASDSNLYANAFVVGNLVWFVLCTKFGYSGTDTGRAMFSYSNTENTFAVHTFGKPVYTVNPVHIIVDDINCSAHIVSSSTTGTIKDMTITGLTSYSHDNSSAITVIDDAVLTLTGKSITDLSVNGYVSDGSYKLFILSLADSKMYSVEGKVQSNLQLFATSEIVPQQIQSIYSGVKHTEETPVDISFVVGKKPILQFTKTVGSVVIKDLYRIYTEGMYFIDSFCFNDYTPNNELFAFAFSDDTLSVLLRCGSSKRLDTYSVSTIHVANDYRNLTNIDYFKDYNDSSTSVESNVSVVVDASAPVTSVAGQLVLGKCKDYALVYNKSSNAIYRYEYDDRIFNKIIDFDEDTDYSVSDVSALYGTDNNAYIVSADGSVYSLNYSTRYMNKLGTITGQIKTCYSDDSLFIYATADKLYVCKIEDNNISKVIGTVDSLTLASYSQILYNSESDTFIVSTLYDASNSPNHAVAVGFRVSESSVTTLNTISVPLVEPTGASTVVKTGYIVDPFTLVGYNLSRAFGPNSLSYKYSGSDIVAYDPFTGSAVATLTSNAISYPSASIIPVIDYAISKDSIFAFSVVDSKVCVIRADKPFSNYAMSVFDRTALTPTINNLLRTNNTFEANGNIYVYGTSDDYTKLYTYNKNTGLLDLFASGMTPSDSSTIKLISVKPMIDGTVKFAYLQVYQANSVHIVISTYSLSAKAVVETKSVDVTVTGASASALNCTASDKSIWISKYFFTTIGVNDGNGTTTTVCVDTSLSTVTQYSNLFKAKSDLEYFDGNIYSLGGAKSIASTGVTGIENIDIDSDLSILNSPYATKNAYSLSLKYLDSVKYVMQGMLIKSGHKLVGSFLTDNADGSKKGFIELSKDNSTLFTNSESYGVKTNVKSSSESVVQSYLSIPTVTLNTITAKQFPMTDNAIAVGYTNSDSTNSVLSDEDKFAIRTIAIPPSPCYTFTFNNYVMQVFTGATKDTFVTSDKYGNKIYSVDVERDYGVTIDHILPIESEGQIFIFTDGCPTISTAIVHEDGKITVKRYDDTNFGKSIDPSNNNCAVQELDLTLLFDEEMSERTLRGM